MAAGGQVNRHRLRGEARAATTAEVGGLYRDGATLRQVMERTGLSYGTVRTLVLEDGQQLRARGGDRRG